MDTLPPPPGRSCHPTVVPRHTWTHPSSQTQTHTDTPSPGGWLTDTGPDAPPSAATPTRPTGPSAPTDTQPHGQHFCALCSQAHPQCSTHTHTHACTYACGCAAWPFCHSSPRHHGPTQSGSGGGSMADQPPVHLPGTAELQESGTQTPHWTLYSFPAMATGRAAWNRGSFFQDSGARMLGIKVWTGPRSQRLQGRVFPVSSSFWGALDLWPHHPSPPPPSHGYFLPPCLSIKTLAALLCYGLILTASTETRFPNKVPSLWGHHSAPSRFPPGTWGFICP